MSEKFDPYHKWLGIPPQDQPPNHYRLLGLELFESDPDVITTAADGRMAQVKRFQTGKYSAFSQRLLNEIAGAKVCLLNAEQKAQHDDQLRSQLAEQQQQAAEAQASASPRRPPPRRVSAAAGASNGLPSACVASYLAARRRSTRPRVKVVAAVAAGLLAVGLGALGGWIWWSRTPGADTTVTLRPNSEAPGSALESPSARPGSQSGPQSPAGSGPTSPNSDTPGAPEEPVEPPMPIPEPGPPVEPLPGAVPGQSPGGLEPAGPTEQPPQEPFLRPLAQLIDPEGPGQTALEGGSPGEPAASAPETPPEQKLPVPDAQACREAEQQIREVFARELAEADTAEKKRRLAELFYQQGQEVLEEPEIRFVAVQMAGRLAAEGGEIELALATANWLGERYELDALGAKAQLLEVVLSATGTGSQSATASERVFQSAMTLAATAAVQDEYDAAGQLMRVAVMAARRTRDPARLRQATVFERELDRQQAGFRAAESALELLAEEPDHAEANLTVGRWQCFQKGDWQEGLPYLSRGSDAALAQVAQQDLAGANDPPGWVRLADEWGRLARRAQGSEQVAMAGRAAAYYEKALPALEGLEKLRVERELEALAELQRAAGPAVLGIAREGNVALASRGTKVEGPEGSEALIDGNATRYDGHSGWSWARPPGVWTITFPDTYRLQAIRFLLYDLNPRIHYRYKVEVSSDGEHFELLADRSQGEWRGWQVLTFRPRPVKAVRLHALDVFGNNAFIVVEFEAYCEVPLSR